MKTAAVILAAGYASRMGRCKSLLPLAGLPALEFAQRRLEAAGVSHTIVVTGHWREAVEPVAERLGCAAAYNERYPEGMFSSVQTGVAALPEDVEGFLLLPSDTPLARSSSYRLVMERAAQGDCDVVSPRFRSVRGHPPWISRRLVGPILEWDGHDGLRGLLRNYHDSTVVVDVADVGVHVGMNRPEEYEELAAIAGRELPTPEEEEALFEIAGTAEAVRRHSEAVAALADALAAALEGKGYPVDRVYLGAAARLHDLAKGERRHGEAAADLLTRQGFPKLAGIVADHMDLPDPVILDPPGERELLYLADKTVSGEEYVPLEERTRTKEAQFAGNAEAQTAVARRMGKAMEVREAWGRCTGLSLGDLAQNVVAVSG
ncbi:MAG: nucleotidyltransferase family protein [Synergistales bacterium]|nr:nucleotidyltransferase family protein [Synergistales bacterium]